MLSCAALSGSPESVPQVVVVEAEAGPSLPSDGVLAPNGQVGGAGRPPNLLQQLVMLVLRLLRRAAKAVQGFLALPGFLQSRYAALGL